MRGFCKFLCRKTKFWGYFAEFLQVELAKFCKIIQNFKKKIYSSLKICDKKAWFIGRKWREQFENVSSHRFYIRFCSKSPQNRRMWCESLLKKHASSNTVKIWSGHKWYYMFSWKMNKTRMYCTCSRPIYYERIKA